MRPLYRYFVTAPYLNGKPGCWVDAADDAEAIRNACRKMDLDYKEYAVSMRAYRIGKVGLDSSAHRASE